MTLHKMVNGVQIEMHPLEEQEMLAQWALGDVDKKMPRKPSQRDEHEWLIEHGSEHVKEKREEWRKGCEALQPEWDIAEAKRMECYTNWCVHAKHCKENGLDHNTHDKDKHVIEKL